MIQMLFLLGIGFNCFVMAYECDQDTHMQPKWFMWLLVLMPYFIILAWAFLKIIDWYEERK